MCKFKPAFQRGFTILELIVVVGILGLITSLTADFMVNETNQERYNITQKRMQQIHYALIGDNSRSLNNQPVFSGYLADTGVVPKYLRDLLSNGYCTKATINTEPDCLAKNAEWREVKNWKGPYLQTTDHKKIYDDNNKVITTIPVFRDGWGNHLSFDNQDLTSKDNLNFGWGYIESIKDKNITFTSYGLNGPAIKVEDSESPTYVFEQDITRTINGSQYQGAVMSLNIINNSDTENGMFCLQVKYPDGNTKNIDLGTQQSIPAGKIFGKVTVAGFKKEVGVNGNCELIVSSPEIKSSSYYSHNLFGVHNILNISITSNGLNAGEKISQHYR